MTRIVEINIANHWQYIKINIDKIKDLIIQMSKHYCVSDFITVEVLLKKQIKEDNLLYRNKNKDTDIISLQVNHDVQSIKLPIVLGIILLSEDIMHIKIIKYSYDYIYYIIIHGILHLCDFKHDRDEEFLVMRTEEEKWVRRLKLNVQMLKKIYQ